MRNGQIPSAVYSIFMCFEQNKFGQIMRGNAANEKNWMNLTSVEIFEVFFNNEYLHFLQSGFQQF